MKLYKITKYGKGGLHIPVPKKEGFSENMFVNISAEGEKIVTDKDIIINDLNEQIQLIHKKIDALIEIHKKPIKDIVPNQIKHIPITDTTQISSKHKYIIDNITDAEQEFINKYVSCKDELNKNVLKLNAIKQFGSQRTQDLINM
jgi:hypothetical protein